MDSLDEVARTVRSCTDCPLHTGRTNAVPGEGNPQADVMFIGEGPGFHEDRQGRPFVGPAGQLLEGLLASIGTNRSEVFIANMVKCRPPDNRDPAPSEISACSKYLDRQIELLNPKLIVTLGRFSLGRFFPGESITPGPGKGAREGRPTGVPGAAPGRRPPPDGTAQRAGGGLPLHCELAGARGKTIPKLPQANGTRRRSRGSTGASISAGPGRGATGVRSRAAGPGSGTGRRCGGVRWAVNGTEN